MSFLSRLFNQNPIKEQVSLLQKPSEQPISDEQQVHNKYVQFINLKIGNSYTHMKESADFLSQKHPMSGKTMLEHYLPDLAKSHVTGLWQVTIAESVEALSKGKSITALQAEKIESAKAGELKFDFMAPSLAFSQFERGLCHHHDGRIIRTEDNIRLAKALVLYYKASNESGHKLDEDPLAKDAHDKYLELSEAKFIPGMTAKHVLSLVHPDMSTADFKSIAGSINRLSNAELDKSSMGKHGLLFESTESETHEKAIIALRLLELNKLNGVAFPIDDFKDVLEHVVVADAIKGVQQGMELTQTQFDLLVKYISAKYIDSPLLGIDILHTGEFDKISGQLTTVEDPVDGSRDTMRVIHAKTTKLVCNLALQLPQKQAGLSLSEEQKTALHQKITATSVILGNTGTYMEVAPN